MERTSNFRGLAGEVIYSVVRPDIFITLIPVALTWVFVALVSLGLGRAHAGAFVPILWVAAWAALVARFAVAASQGDITAGFLNSYASSPEARAFPAKYLAVMALFAVGFAACAYPLYKSEGGLLLWTVRMLGSGIGGAMNSVASALLFIAVITFPTLSLIILTASGSVLAVFKPASWRWLLLERGQDLVCFYAALIGGLITSFLVYLIPLLLLARYGFKVSLGFGFFCSSLLYFFPASVSPVLLGRLCGAFVFGSESLSIQPALTAKQQALKESMTRMQTALSVAKRKTPATPPERKEEPAPESPAATSAAQNPSAASPFLALEADPSQTIIVAIKTVLAGLPDVLAGSLFRWRNDGRITTVLGVELASDCALRVRQRVTSELGQALARSGGQDLKAMVLDTQMAQETAEVALTVYKRKSTF